jgi:hypothetical protein
MRTWRQQRIVRTRNPKLVRLGSERGRKAIHWSEKGMNFITDPKDVGGVLTELVQAAEAG